MKWTFESVVEKSSCMHVTLQAQAMVRCKGITKAGNQCSVTSSSSWVDDNGRLVAAPLCRGGDFRALHAKPFCVKPIILDNFERMVVLILDLETTGGNRFLLLPLTLVTLGEGGGAKSGTR